MKLFLLSFILLLMLGPVYAQQNPLADQRATKFISYFNAGQTDSLYTLFADEIKPQVPLASLNAAVQQFRNGFGPLIKSAYTGAQNGANIYTITFEKPGVVLYVAFNTANKITGFFKGVVDVSEPAGSVTVKTANSVLKGTLSVPPSTKPVPVVLLIAGNTKCYSFFRRSKD